MLPKLRSGDAIVTRRGYRWRVLRLRRPTRDTGYDEPIYKIMYGSITGRQEWTLDELNAAGQFKKSSTALPATQRTTQRTSVGWATQRAEGQER